MRITILAILLTLLTCTAFGNDSEGPLEFQYNVSVSSKIFKNLSPDELVSAFGLWAKTALKGKINEEDLKVDVFDGPAALGKMLKKGKYDCHIIAAEDIDLSLISPEKVLIPLKNSEKFTQYVVLANKDHAIKNLSDLKNRKVVLYDGYGMNLAEIWLEHAIKSGAEKDSNLWPLKLTMTDKPMEGIYQVFFGQSDAVVVSLQAFRTACLLNPQLEQKLGILLSSPKLVPMAFFFDPNVKSKNQDILLESIRTMHNTPGGKQVLMIFQCTQVEQHPIAVMRETFAFLREARALR
jgi:ABC-type amino acid transport substrate-binding protein